MQPTTYVAYYRVSTAQQGRSGLGLEAQRTACAGFSPIAEFIEVESGKHDDRAVLAEAVSYARTHNATLVLAKLDRLSRDVEFIAGFMKRGVAFRCADMPDSDEFMLHIYASFAHKERRFISDRTRAAIAAKRARGQAWGTNSVRVTAADQYAQCLAPIIKPMLASGPIRASVIARELNARGIATAQGGTWGSGQVLRLIARLDGTSVV